MFIKVAAFLLVMAFSIATFGSTNVFIDGKKIKNSGDLQRLLDKELHVPAHYAKNLDSIYEKLLGDLKTDTIVRIKNQSFLRKKISDQYVDDLIEIVNMAAEDNPHVILILE